MSDFDLDRFLQLSGPVKMDDLDWDECRAVGVTDAEARILRYTADTETHTILYLRDLLAGHSCHDPEVTSFLSVWVYEELWHGRAIDTLLVRAGREVAADTYARVSKSVSWREPMEAILSHLAAYATARFAAVHMAWGAINELSAAAAYKVMERTTANRPLAILLNRIAKQERKHFSFYYHQARKRLENDLSAQRLCRFALKAFWAPVGSGVGHADNLAFLTKTLFNDEAGQRALAEVDETIRRLPGLGNFDLVSQRVGKILHKTGESVWLRTTPATVQLQS